MGVHAPLSLAQRRLWFLYQLDPRSPEYNISRAWRLKGSLNTAGLITSLNLILTRHETLRTTFQEIDGQPIQVIQPTLTAPFQERDCSSYSPAQLEAKIDQFLIDESLHPFDLFTGPLLRFNLIRCGLDDHVFIFTVHHMVCDGTSFKIFCQELSLCYAGTLAGQPISLAALPIQYQNFSNWQQDYLTDDKLASQLAFWKQHLQGAPLVLQLPSDCSRTQENTGPGKFQVFTLALQVVSRLKQLIQPQGITLFMALLAVFQILLTRYTGQRDMLVGTPIAGRTHIDLEELIGFFVNTLILRIQFKGQPSFWDVLRQVRATCLGAYAHQSLPFEKLVEALNPVRDPHRHPIVQAIFQLRQASDLRLTFPEISAHALLIKKRTGNFDLHMVCEETESGIRGVLYYPQDLFLDATMASFAKHYQLLLEGLIANPQRPIWQVPFLTDAECHQQLIDWNNTAEDYPGNKYMHQMFEEQVERTPEAIALVSEEQELTYWKLNERANQLAHFLIKRGVGPEVRVGVCMERSSNLVISLLAILKAGGAYVPLDPVYPKKRLAYMLADTQASVLLTQVSIRSRLPAYTGQMITLEGESFQHESSENLLCSTVPKNLSYVLYTSGSTGRPKGVLISHAGLMNYLTWCIEAYELKKATEAIVHSSIGFDLTVTSLFAPLLVGRRVRLLDEAGGLEEIAAALRIHGEFSLLKMTPSHLEGLNQLLTPEEVSGQIRILILGGEALSEKTLAGWNLRGPWPKIMNEYGPTETVVGCCVYEIPSESSLNGLVPIGRPISNMQMYLLDRNVQLLPIGVPGEMYIGGVGLARGYQGRPDLTAERFIPHPHNQESGARLYKSGDLGRHLHDGTIEFLGHMDSQVKIRGYRIEPEEIRTILDQHPGVQASVVVCQEDISDEKNLVAYFVPAPEAPIEPAILSKYLRTHFPDYMVPVAFVRLDILPTTLNGKINRRALPRPNQTHLVQKTAYMAPRTLLEELLAEIWGAVLNVDRIGLHDNFFALGGHSLLATQVIGQFRQVLELDLSLRILFEHPTIEQLAREIDTRLANTFPDWPKEDSPLS